MRKSEIFAETINLVAQETENTRQPNTIFG